MPYLQGLTFTPLFHSLLRFYHLFPLHSPATLFLLDAPWGRFSYGERRGWEGKLAWGDLDGNWAWAFMEIVSPLTFITTIMRNVNLVALTAGTKIAASLYLIHYAVRAIISPLVLAPKRNPQHIWVTSSSVFFNLMNGYCMGSFLASNPIARGEENTLRFWLLVFGWAVGFLGNVYHDEILHDLRRPSVLFRYLPFLQSRHNTTASSTAQADQSVSKDRIASTNKSGVQEKQNQGARVDDGRGRYKIPRGGLFYWITFPNYFCEWSEWTFYALLLSPIPFIPSPLSASTSTSGYSPLAQRFISIMASLPFPPYLLSPPWMFLVALLTAMIPRAIRGEGWYRERFGDKWLESGRKGGRWSCLPGLV